MNLNAVARVFAAVMGLFLGQFAVSVFVMQAAFGFEPLGAAYAAAALLSAAICWWFALRGHTEQVRKRMRFAAICGFITGAVGFILGFLGPIVLAPQANQGPLLGIFVTGPLGFFVGLAAGWLIARFRRRQALPISPEVRT
ncbi:MAG TPA: hypothetical protein VJW75_00110 [Candidatus Eisenbacteria bacterium]|nr:hypothetical protein [Candidatus Eisenbacteria bacterium]